MRAFSFCERGSRMKLMSHSRVCRGSAPTLATLGPFVIPPLKPPGPPKPGGPPPGPPPKPPNFLSWGGPWSAPGRAGNPMLPAPACVVWHFWQCVSKVRRAAANWAGTSTGATAGAGDGAGMVGAPGDITGAGAALLQPAAGKRMNIPTSNNAETNLRIINLPFAVHGVVAAAVRQTLPERGDGIRPETASQSAFAIASFAPASRAPGSAPFRAGEFPWTFWVLRTRLGDG